MKQRTERPTRQAAAEPEQIAAPPWWLLACESRAVLEFAAGTALRPLLQRKAPRGASHLGMASSPAALYLLAERLAQPEGHWTPFRPTGWQCLAYGVDDHGAAPAADRNPGAAAA